MNSSDLAFIFQWWGMIFILGGIFLPITFFIFSKFLDKGYIFSKILSIAVLSYITFLFGTLKIAPFSKSSVFFFVSVLLAINLFLFFKNQKEIEKTKKLWKVFLAEEIIFFAGLAFWSYIRGFQPDIHGLEKYMDFGFINSILRSNYFPPKDMWFTPFTINYYYFGHLTTAVLTRLSGIPSSITFNLMLGTIFGFIFTGTLSISANLLNEVTGIKKNISIVFFSKKALICGLLAGFLITFGGNLHTLYTFFKPYQNENPVPPWQLDFSLQTFPNSYWYPNATRFIYHTIHEFPIYSFVVSDLHGHVLDIPFVLLTIAVLLSLLINFTNATNINQKSKIKNQNYNAKLKNLLEIVNWKLEIPLLSFLIAAMYMTNAWDGFIYALLTFLIFIYLSYRTKNFTLYALRFTLIIIGFILFSLPFSFFFQTSEIVHGIGILCAPNFLTNTGKIGPFLFEADHCQRSPVWQLIILYGFFYFWAASFIFILFKKINLNRIKLISNLKIKIENLSVNDIFILLLILLSTALIIIPEFFYVKDIYPAHYRANTMFKLVYQSFIMLSICSGYIIVRIISNFKFQISNYWKLVYLIIGIIGLFLVSIYPYFAINSYYGNLQTYYGLDGTAYLKKLYPTDYAAIAWLNENIKGQLVILEAQGDSYTDYARISANTGLPTVLGWTVHEWLWRGSYDVPAPRITDVETLYDTSNMELAKTLIDKYKVSLVFVGDLEREKYLNLDVQKFQNLGKIIYQNGSTKIYQIKPQPI